MNPIINPMTVGFLCAALVGLCVGAVIGRRYSGSYGRMIWGCVKGLGIVYVIGLPIGLLFGLWVVMAGGASLREAFTPMATMVWFAFFATAMGMLTGVPGFLYGYYLGWLRNRQLMLETGAEPNP